MSAQIFILDKVSESQLLDVVKEAGDDNADIVTAINDDKGAFTVEETFFQPDAAGTAGSIVLDGKMSTFGGPGDPGVKPDEGLSLFAPGEADDNPDIFLPAQPPGTTGLAKRLNPDALYLACRWDTAVTPKSFLKAKTTKVKVSNPATGKSADARPADTGPAIETGRVADLSPGLAKALGLATDNACHVDIPMPAGAQSPPAGTGVAVGVNLAQIDSTIFAPGAGMARTLVAMTTSNNTTYWVINLIGQNDGGQSLLRHAGDKTDVLLTDTTVFPVKASDQIPAAVADELNKAAVAPAPPAQQGGNPPQPGDDINAKMFAEAKAFVDHDTSSDPRTDGGNLACAWAVNEVARIALGKPISTEGGMNGVSTVQMFDVLNTHHTRLNSAGDAKPGTIIIAPTGQRHGHVGVVGATTGGVGDTLVYSNKSVPGVFKQNFTIKSFTDHYTGIGLQVLFFALNKDQF